MEKRMDFVIWGSESTRGFDAVGTCAYFDIEEEMRALKKEWRRNEVVTMFALTPEPKKIPKHLVKYFKEKPEHSGNLVLSKMLFDGPTSIFEEENVGRKYNISIGTFTFTKSLMVRVRIYTEDKFDYMDTEFALSYVTWRDKK